MSKTQTDDTTQRNATQCNLFNTSQGFGSAEHGAAAAASAAALATGARPFGRSVGTYGKLSSQRMTARSRGDKSSSSASFSREPDCRVHVYNSELGKLFSHDCGPLHSPCEHYWDDEESHFLAVESRASTDVRRARALLQVRLA